MDVTFDKRATGFISLAKQSTNSITINEKPGPFLMGKQRFIYCMFESFVWYTLGKRACTFVTKAKQSQVEFVSIPSSTI